MAEMCVIIIQRMAGCAVDQSHRPRRSLTTAKDRGDTTSDLCCHVVAQMPAYGSPTPARPQTIQSNSENLAIALALAGISYAGKAAGSSSRVGSSCLHLSIGIEQAGHLV